MNSYNLSFSRLIRLLLPGFLRQNGIRVFIGILLKPVETLYVGFIKYHRQNIRHIKTTSQVFSMEKVLNENFGIDNMDVNYIKIRDPKRAIAVHLFLDEEPVKHSLLSINLPPLSVYTAKETFAFHPDFWISIPYQYIKEEKERKVAELIQIIKTYKMPSKTCLLEYTEDESINQVMIH